MTAADTVRSILVDAGLIDDDRSWQFTCDHIAREASQGPQRVAQLLDAHRVAVEDDPDTQTVARRIVEALRGDT